MSERQKMGEVGEGAIIRLPFHCDMSRTSRRVAACS
jgi:hypothetical protein